LQNEEGRLLLMLKKCYFCKGKVAEQRVTIDYRWGDTLVVINDVPAGVCRQCGEKYLASDVYKDLEEAAISKSHIMGRMTIDILKLEANAAV